MIKYIMTIFVLSTLLFGQTSEDFFEDSVDDLQETLQEAKDSGKKGIFLFFEMDNCPFCARMEQNVLNQDEIIKVYKENFINLTVDIKGSIDMVDFDGTDTLQKKFAFKHKIRATPVQMFFDLNGKKIFKRTGYTDAKTFLLMGRYITDGIYKKENFIKYKRRMLK